MEHSKSQEPPPVADNNPANDVGVANVLEEEEVHMTEPLCKQFKKPPPGKNRRRPSQGHLQKRAAVLSDPEVPPIVPPLDIPHSARSEESPPIVPSAPSGTEVTSQLLTYISHEAC